MDTKLTIAHYIKALAEKYENRTAIYFRSVFRTFSFTYREVCERALRVANYLSKNGIQKGDRILVWSYNGREYGSILLGCALSGVVAVPVDFSCKADFVALIAKTVGAKHLFHSKRRPFPSDSLSHLHVEDLDRDLEQVTVTQTDFEIRDDDVYEIVYTSGTTSDPKGVIITNRNIVTNIMHSAEIMPIRDDNMFLSILPLSHMFEQLAGFFYPLYNGCTVTYLSSRKSTTVIEALLRHRVSIMVVVPIFLDVLRQSLLREVEARGKTDLFSGMLALAGRVPRRARRFLFRGVRKKFGGRLNMFITGGSALDPELHRFWDRLGFLVLPGYGLTEASPVVALNTPTHHRIGAVGRPLPHQDIQLGPENEIRIRGNHVTPGYFENPMENAARFEDGWYKTGDIGEFDDDGYLYIRGRLKNMIKSASGLNVYPEDIETVLDKVPEIRDSCVIGLEEAGDVRVHAVLLMEKGREWNDEGVRPLVEQANRQLQPHQHVQGFTIWRHEDFPRTHTLKIKRGPVIEEIKHGRPIGGFAQRGTGDRIVDLVADLAKVDPQAVTPESNLVSDLGLDSIARVELATLLEEEFNVEVDESAFDFNTTVGRIREIIAAKRKETLDYTFPRWARAWPIRALRRCLQLLVLRIPTLFSRTKVEGRQNLEDIERPVIFICNHVNHYDMLFILRALPRRLRRRLAVAAAADVLFECKPGDGLWRRLDVRFRGFWTTILFNTFPLSRGTHIKKSFEYMGELIDEGCHALLFPEGKLATADVISPFKSGIGLLTQAMRVPVVPMRLDGSFPLVRVYGPRSVGWFPRRFARVRVLFGKPMDIDEKADPDDVARMCEDAVRSLSARRADQSY